MNIRKKSGNRLFSLAFLLAFLLNACKNEDAQNHKDPSMHVDSLPPDIEPLIASPNKQVLSRQQTVKLQEGGIGKTIQARGYIAMAQNRNQSVAARFGGRIEKLYIKFNLQQVKRGEKIMDIYSPSLSAIQEEHIFLFTSGSESSLLKNSRKKLRLLGITENQISGLEKNGKVARSVSVFSPSDGYVFFKMPGAQAVKPGINKAAMEGMDNQNNRSEKSFNTSASQIREGIYVNEGQTLFTINDLQQVWALISIPDEVVQQIKPNQTVTIHPENNPTATFSGSVELIEQTFEEANQRFARLRVVLANAKNTLKINALLKANISLSDHRNLQVPTSAVYKAGLNHYVWVKSDTTKNGTGVFRLRSVITGESRSGMIAIKSGLSANEEIANQAGYLADSETFLKEK